MMSNKTGLSLGKVDIAQVAVAKLVQVWVHDADRDMHILFFHPCGSDVTAKLLRKEIALHRDELSESAGGWLPLAYGRYVLIHLMLSLSSDGLEPLLFIHEAASQELASLLAEALEREGDTRL